MPTLSPHTLTKAEQSTLLAVTATHPRDHLTFSFALGTGLRLGEIVGLDVGDVYSATGQPKSRVRIRAEIAKGGRDCDVGNCDTGGCLLAIQLVSKFLRESSMLLGFVDV